MYLVDESSLASTNQISEFLTRLGPNDHVLLIGDTRQHQAVEAGRPFEQLQEAGMHTAKLDEIVRQQDPALKSAVEMLATGQVSAALDALQQQGRVKEIPNREERVLAIAKTYIESPEKALQVYAAAGNRFSAIAMYWPLPSATFVTDTLPISSSVGFLFI